MITCPRCEAAFPDEALNYCGRCGADLQRLGSAAPRPIAEAQPLAGAQEISAPPARTADAMVGRVIGGRYRILDRIGDRWTVLVIGVLGHGEVRFSELRRRVEGISQKMLSVTLQGLTRDGLVGRRVEPTVPPRVYYRLTPLGLTLEEPLAALREWAEAHMTEVDRARRRSEEEGAAD